jgi:hypothetical protein
MIWGMNPQYSDFWQVGTFVVTLNVTDEANNSDTDTMNVTVEFDRSPEADAGPTHTICAGENVILDASGSNDDNPIIDLTFNWTFDDGTGPVFLPGMIVAHQFNIGGNFLITLEVTDISGNWDIATTWVNVTVCYRPVVLNAGPRGPDKLANVTLWADFSKDMDETSLKNAFSLEEVLSGAPVVTFMSYDIATRNFTATPFAPLSYGTWYRACFNGSIARDMEGFYLDGNKNNVSEGHPTDTYCWEFRTANLPSVGYTLPTPGEMNRSA